MRPANMNFGKVLRLLIQHGPLSRIDLADLLSLTRASVTILVNDMLHMGVLQEIGEDHKRSPKNARGRKKIYLSFNENFRLAVGVVWMPGQLLLGLTNLLGQTLERISIPTVGIKREQVTDRLKREVLKILGRNWIDPDCLLGVAVCISPKIKSDWKEEELGSFQMELEAAVHKPVFLGATAEGIGAAEQLFFSSFSSTDYFLLDFSKDNWPIYWFFADRGDTFRELELPCFVKKGEELVYLPDQCRASHLSVDLFAASFLCVFRAIRPEKVLLYHLDEKTEDIFRALKKMDGTFSEQQMLKSHLDEENLYLAASALCVKIFFWETV
ncbi:MAG: MarR family transcriptional regulator [Clostridiales bacterium]|nr:MarR family transcriptional regulator [Clostridiales bacterium]